MAKENKNIFNNLWYLFGGKISQKGSSVKLEIPAIKKLDKDGKKYKRSFEKAPTRLDELWNYFINQCHDTNESFRNIQEVYVDMDYMYFNSTIYSRSLDNYTDEIVQEDSQKNILEVYSKDKKAEKVITDLFNTLKIPDKIRSTGRSVVHKGNAVWVMSINKNLGITDVTQVKTEQLKSRIEFTPLEVEDEVVKNITLSNLFQNNVRLKMLLQDIDNFEDTNAIFKQYLLGYQINNYILSPWSVLHFRNKVLDSAFLPFGMPLLINCVAPFRMYDASLSMHTLARGMKFPREKIDVDIPNAHPTEMIESLLEFVSEYENCGLAETESNKQEFTLGSKVYTVKGLYDVSLIENRQNLDDIADVELLKDNLILGTGLPRGLLVPNESFSGNTGISLIQQYKPFARTVFHLQRSILEELSLMVRIHFAFVGIDPNTEFEISMPFPQSQEDPDLMRNKSDQLKFADDVMSSLKDNVVGDRDAKIPPDVALMIYTTILPFDDDELIKWITKTVKYNEPEILEESNKKDTRYKKILKEGGREKADNYVRSVITKDDVKMYEYDIRKKRNWSEGIRNNRHFLSSYGIQYQFDINSINLKDEGRKDLIKETENKSLNNIIKELKERRGQLYEIVDEKNNSKKRLKK